MLSRIKISNIGKYRNESVISGMSFFASVAKTYFVQTGSKYIAIKDEGLQIIERPRL